jgi:hypothetical protein
VAIASRQQKIGPPKRIIFCADGTWHGAQGETNVSKFYNSLSSGSDQVRIYDDGLGPNGLPIEKLTGDEFGEALYAKIKDGYSRIASEYRPGDQVFLFGFSRGAYTARSIAAMIAICGLPLKGELDEASLAITFEAYRDPLKRSSLLNELADQPSWHTNVEMLGVWETVGSLGIPAHISGSIVSRYGFLDTTLHVSIQNAYQALAIDERRAQYPPTLWTSTPAQGQTVEQVWFSGTHGDVGGGEEWSGDRPLSDIPLYWMVGKARELGVRFQIVDSIGYSMPEIAFAANAEMHESWSALWGAPSFRAIPSHTEISNSVALRCKSLATYRPGNLEILADGSLHSHYYISPVLPLDVDSDDFQRLAEERQRQTSTAKRKDALEDAVAFRTTYPAFEGDLVGFDRRSFKEPLRDSLGADVYAGHLAQLIAARSTQLPLSLGLFGAWGAGKSFFMRLLHQKVDELATRKDDVFCRKVVQIHFNAWHYLDTNLWASLVCEIFDKLFAQLAERPDTTEAKVEELKQKLAKESALAAETKKELAAATQAREDAEKEWRDAAQKRKETEASIATYIDDLANVALDDDTRKQLKQLADKFGLTQLGESYADLEARAMEARTLAGRFRTLVLALLSPEGIWKRLSLLLAAFVVPLVIAYAVPRILKIQSDDLRAIVQSITAAATLIGAIATWISAQTKRGSELLGKLESAYKRVKEAQEKRRKGMEGSQAQRVLDKCIKDEADASAKLSETQAKVRSLESELRDLTPGRRLLHFLEQRVGGSDYRQYLGLVSLVRRDFQQLNDLLSEGSNPGATEEPLLDRIVLYIDDLDRCNSDRVVAVLEAVHLLLAFPIFAVVVAVDPKWLRQSLMEHYPRLLAEARNGDAHFAAELENGPASPQDYLEKIFQVPFQIQPIEKPGFAALVGDLLKPVAPPRPGPAASAGPGPVVPTPSPVGGAAADLAQNATPAERSVEQAAQPPASDVTTAPAASAAATRPVQAAPERLQLEAWEKAAINRCYPLFRTPRAVKRLVNTYCLIRVGVDENAWQDFLGSEKSPEAEYRIPLLMMAVAAAYPGFASQWLRNVVAEKGWMPAVEVGADGKGSHAQSEWNQLTEKIREINASEFAPFDDATVRKWCPMVRRYFF